MRVGEIIDEVKLMLHVNQSQLNDDIAQVNYRRLVQQAYESLWSDIRTEVSEANLLTKFDMKWDPIPPVQTMELPVGLQDKLIWDIWQLGFDGQPLCPANVFFETRNVLRMPLGPVLTADMLLRIYYIPDTETFVTDDQTPLLIPRHHHRVIVWQTLSDIKILWDKTIPDQWTSRLENLKSTMLQELRTRPVAQRANIMPRFRMAAFGGLAGGIL